MSLKITRNALDTSIIEIDDNCTSTSSMNRFLVFCQAFDAKQ